MKHKNADQISEGVSPTKAHEREILQKKLLLNRIFQAQNFSYRFFVWYCTILGAMLLVCITTWVATISVNFAFYVGIITLGSTFVPAWFILLLLDRFGSRVANKIYRNNIEPLTDKRLISDWIRIALCSRGNEKRQSYEMLNLLLPQVQPDEKQLLNWKSREQLYGSKASLLFLSLVSDVKLCSQIIDFIKRTGDRQAYNSLVEFVEAANSSPCRQEAQDCLVALANKLPSLPLEEQILLRASAPTISQDTLLRAASDATKTAADAPEQLLRTAPTLHNAPSMPLSSQPAQSTSEETPQVLRGTTGQDSTPPD